MSSNPIVVAQALSRRFGSRRAVEGASFELLAGHSLALFGPNGAGKTTLMRMLAGLLRPTSGSASVAGVALPGGTAARAQVGMIGHHSMLYPALTAAENVEFAARLHGLPDATNVARHALDGVGILDRAAVPVRALSRGLQQRVAIARSTVHRPKLLLCDEPFGALDEITREAMNDELLRIWGETHKTVVFVTHSIPEAVFLSSRIVVMTPRPGKIERIIEVDLPYPRDESVRQSRRFFELTTQVREALKGMH